MGLLEQLNGSQTVGSTVMTLFSFGSFNLLSILLLITWAFSPLGTQGLLRMESRRNEPRVKDITITYFDDGARSRLVKWQELFSTGSFGPTPGMRSLTSLYATLVTTPEATKFDTMDLWGNVRIPFLNHTENEWRDLPSNSSEIEYSSLAGIPISNLILATRPLPWSPAILTSAATMQLFSLVIRHLRASLHIWTVQ